MGRILRCDPQLLEKDLAGRTYIVTGANSGVGLATAQQLVHQGAHVVMACRRVDAARHVAERLTGDAGSFEVMKLDLSSLGSVREFAATFLGEHDRLDGLVNNAGLVSTRLLKTDDGLELMFGVNHLGHFLLTELLLEVLKASAPARVVILSSVVHAGRPGQRVSIDFDDLHYERRAFRGMAGYAESKLANVLHARELARRLEGTGVAVFSVHPGWARSNLVASAMPAWIQNVVMRPLSGPLTMMSNEDGAQTSLHCLLDEGAPRHTGEYFSQISRLYADTDCRAGGWPMRSPNEHANDDRLARRLYEVSCELAGLPGAREPVTSDTSGSHAANAGTH